MRKEWVKLDYNGFACKNWILGQALTAILQRETVSIPCHCVSDTNMITAENNNVMDAAVVCSCSMALWVVLF